MSYMPMPRIATTLQSSDRAAIATRGEAIRLRAIRADDRPLLLQLVDSLSDRSGYQRFMVGGLEVRHDHITRLVTDPNAIVVLAEIDRVPVGMASVHPGAGGNGEIALLVSDQYQHQGIGTLLLAEAVARARRRGINSLVAWVLANNAQMLGLVHGTQHGVTIDRYGDVVRVKWDLAADSRRESDSSADGNTLSHCAGGGGHQ